MTNAFLKIDDSISLAPLATTLANEAKNLGATTLNYAASSPILWKNGIIFRNSALMLFKATTKDMGRRAWARKHDKKFCVLLIGHGY